MNRPDKTSDIYDHHKAARIGMASRDYTEDLERYCDWLESLINGIDQALFNGAYVPQRTILPSPYDLIDEFRGKP